MILSDNDLMPFGKYKGVGMKDVPADYLLELKEKGFRGKTKPGDIPAVMRYVDRNWDLLTSVAPMPEYDEDLEIDEDIDFNIFDEEL